MTGNVNGLGDFKSRMIAFVSQQTGISADELKKMSVEELQELAKAKKAVSEELSASISSTKSMEEVDSSQFSLKEPKTAEQKDGWLKRQWDKLPRGAKIGLEVLGGAVAVGIVAAPILGGHGPALFEAAKGLAGAVNGTALAVGATAIGIGGLAMLSGCKKENNPLYPDAPYVDPNGGVNIDVDQNVEVDLSGLYDSLAALIHQQQVTNDKLDEVIQQLLAANQSLAQITQFMIQQGAAINTIIAMLEHQGQQLDVIIQNQEELKPIVEDINNTAHNIQNLTSAQNELLTQMLTTLMSIDHNTQLTNEQIAELKALIHAILAMLNQIDEHNVQNYTQIMQQLAQNTQLLDAILNALHDIDQNNQAAFNQLLAQLIGIGGNIQALLNAVHSNGAVLNQILTAIQNLGSDLGAIQGFLNNIFAEIISMHGDMNQNQTQSMELMNQLIALLQDNNELLVNLNNTIQDWSQQQQAQFAQIMARLMTIIGNQNNANETLNAILNAIQEGNMSVDQVLALLNNISGSMGDIMAQLELMDAHHSQHYQNIMGKMNQILNAILTLDAHTQNGIAAILAKLDTMDEHQMEAFFNMIQRLIEIKQGNDANAQAIIDTIMSLDLGGNVNLQPVLDAINSLNGNVTNQGTALAALLSQMLTKLNSINNKVSAIQTVAQNILAVAQSTNGVAQDILEILQQIAAGLPCDDDECCENIIILLQEILDAIVNGDWNHEGIIDDWGDILG